MSHEKCKYAEDNIRNIIPGLYLGNLSAARDRELLKKYEIRFIICAMLDLDKTLIFNDIKYLHVPIKDNMVITIDTNDLFDYTDRYIERNIINGNILVHCKNGHHRSASIIGSYILKHYEITFNELVKFVNNKRNCAFRRDTNMMKALYTRFNDKIVKVVKKDKYVEFI